MAQKYITSLLNFNKFELKFLYVLALFALNWSAYSQCTPTGNPTISGVDQWNCYVYSPVTTPPAVGFSTNYIGYVTLPEIFDLNMATGSTSGPNLCTMPTDKFAFRMRMNKTVAAGHYSITVGGDDGYRLSIDGGATWLISNWNDHGYATSSSGAIYLSGSTNFVLEYYENTGDARVSFRIESCEVSTAPATVSGVSTICQGTSTTLTASGGTHLPAATYQWGTGTTAGVNAIAGNTPTVSVSPATTTTYWVRRKDNTSCSAAYTSGIFYTVTVTPVSTAPTAISGTNVICAGTGTVLTASGGTMAPGSVYEWGTGAVGSNIITGATGISISVTPAATTTYWVRRISAAGCSVTGVASQQVTVNTISGDQTTYGNNSWIGYVYSPTPTTVPNNFSDNYRGFITQPESFNVNLGAGALSGPSLCGTYAENFAIRFRMQKNLPAGNYTFTVGGDDGYRLSIDGGATFVAGIWSPHTYTTSTHTQYLSGPTNFVMEYYEQSGMAQFSFDYTFCEAYTAPTGIAATATSLCLGGSTTLTATGGTSSASTLFEWGTGAVVNANIIAGQSGPTLTVSPTSTTTYWVRRTGPVPCNSPTAVASTPIVVTVPSVGPTSISGSNAVCRGSGTTLSATGAVPGTNATYQWGIGTVVGSGAVIATGPSATFSPTVNTTYWVRIADAGSCNTFTTGATLPVTVAIPSTAPTGISAAATICLGNSTTLTATGGTHAAGSLYEWGTGTVVGSNVIATTTASSLSVTPTSTTTYWVRRTSNGPCVTTTGVTVQVNVTIPGGDQVSYGVNSWIAYIYAPIPTAPPADNFSDNYRGFYGIPETFDYNIGTASINGPNMCGSYNNNIAVRFKMHKVFPAGFYTFTVGGDDGYRLSLDGGTSWLVSNWQPHLYETSTTETIYLDGSTFLVYEYYDWDNVARASFRYTYCRPSTAPTNIAGTTVACAPSGNIILTASGGIHGASTTFQNTTSATTNATYQWGVGNVAGVNPLVGTAATITVNPGSTTTTYWVRRIDAGICSPNTTDAAFHTITVNTRSTAPTGISGTIAICAGSSTTLTAVGAIEAPDAVYQWGTGTAPNNIIAGETSSSITVSPTVTTPYWVRIIDLAPCAPTISRATTVTVTTLSTAPESITGNNITCSGVSTTLTAVGAVLGTSATYQWGTGTEPGLGIISSTVATATVAPTTTTTYWVRVKIAGACNVFTDAAFYTVNVSTPSVAPGLITGNLALCPGSSTTLTAGATTTADGAIYQWGTGTIGQNIIPDEISASITVSPSVATTYWVRKIDLSPCNTPTAARSATVTINTLSTAPLSISGPSTLCRGIATALTAVGATMGTGGTYQWGTGTEPGTSVISGAGATVNVTPLVTTTYWVRAKTGGACNTFTDAVFITIEVTIPSGAPTGIAGTLIICPGTSTTLTATGGTNADGVTYQWGTGTVGQNIIADENAAAITISPAATTTYWVRKIDLDPCNTPTTHRSVTVTITTLSTAPEQLTAIDTICRGASTVLTVSGGTMGSNAMYQWGSGTVAGQLILGTGTTPTRSVTPTGTTTYWVRRIDNPCAQATDAVFFTVSVNQVSSAPTTINGTPLICQGTVVNLTASGGTHGTAGSFQWGYGTVGENIIAGESGNMISVAPDVTTTYWVRRVDALPCTTVTGVRTYLVTVALPSTAPQLVSGNTDICLGSSTTLTVSGGQMGTNGTYQWGIGSVVGTGTVLSTAASFTVNPAVTTTYWVRRRDLGICNALTDGITATVTVGTVSTAPVAVTGTSTICHGNSTTLTATGGTLGNGATYEWGTGIVGNGILIGENNASIVVSPLATTTYWVRRRNDICSNVTGAAQFVVNVTPVSVAGVLSMPPSEICRNGIPNNITLSGHTGTVVMWQIANDSDFSNAVSNIASTSSTLTGAQIGAIPNTKYVRAVIQNGGCSPVFTLPVVLTVAPVSIYSAGTWSNIPGPASDIEITSGLTLTENLSVCSCKISDGAILTIPSNITMIVRRDIEVNPGSNIVVASSGSIVQIDNDGVNSGNVTISRNTSPMKQYDLSYWSSPVANWKLNQLSPLTRFDKYFSFNPIANSWVTHLNGNQIMDQAKGYAVRAPEWWSLTNSSAGVFTGNFIGVPNTGNIPISIKKGSSAYNLIGNPYPSAIDIDLFLTHPANQDIVNGTIYLWTHNTAVSSQNPGSGVSNYASDDYAKYNLTGGVKTASAAISGGQAPTGKIASGQAFFIAAHPTLPNGDYTATFTNSMRVINENSQFFRSNNATATPLTEKHRVWINIHNAMGAYDELLLGYVQGATDEFDTRFDGAALPGGNFVGIYTLLDTQKLSIQGRAIPFDTSEVIPIGYNSTTAGTFGIAIESLDGLFVNQDVFLIDKLLGTTHNLKSGSYAFSTAIGTFNDRFELRFAAEALQIDDLNDQNGLVTFANNGQIYIKASQLIESVIVYDLTGKLLFERRGIANEMFTSDILGIASQVVLVKITFEDQRKASGKLLID